MFFLVLNLLDNHPLGVDPSLGPSTQSDLFVFLSLFSPNINKSNKSKKNPSLKNSSRGLDKISELSEHLMDSLIPIRDAVRTSILSRDWRFKWTSISKLAFDDKLFVTHRLVRIIDRVLLLHSGPIQKFTLSLSHRCEDDNPDIDIWIRHLSMTSMTELILDFWDLGPMYKVPSSLFYCEALTSLKLCNCCVSLPLSTTFRGFKNLKILYLRLAHAQTLVQTHYLLEKLISGSDVLEDLTLMPYRANLFNYVAPKLKHLCLGGQYIGFGFGVKFNSKFNSPIFHMEYHHENKSWLLPGSINLFKFITPLQSVETLKLDGDVLKYLSVEEAPSVLPELLLLLKNLFISGVNFKSVKELLLILCLLRSAPNLKQLKLLASEKGMDIAEVDDRCAIEIRDSPSTFAQLNSVSLDGVSDSAVEMTFIGILLSSSPTLQKMTIKAAKYLTLDPSEECGEYKLLKNRVRSMCRSTQVEFIFC